MTTSEKALIFKGTYQTKVKIVHNSAEVICIHIKISIGPKTLDEVNCNSPDGKIRLDHFYSILKTYSFYIFFQNGGVS